MTSDRLLLAYVREFIAKLRRKPIIPYPLSATKITLDLNPFGFWLKPSFRHRRDLTEFAREQGTTVWEFRWLWFQISYGRWL